MLYKLWNHRSVIEIYEESFCSTITNQRETLHNIHESEKTWYDFLLAPDSAFFKHPPLPLFPSQKLRHQVSQSVYPISLAFASMTFFQCFSFQSQSLSFLQSLGLVLINEDLLQKAARVMRRSIGSFNIFPGIHKGIRTFENWFFQILLPRRAKMVFKCLTQVLDLIVNFLIRGKIGDRNFLLIDQALKFISNL